MPNYTTNLNLEKPLQSEQYNIDVFNANADKIDQFAGQTPTRALTADKLTTGAKINGVNFKGDTDIVTGAGFYYDTVTYGAGNLAFIYNSIGNLELHKSLQNLNIGHNPLTSTGYWEKVELGGAGGRNVGEIISSTLPLTDAGLYLLDGTRLSGDGIYKGFVDYIADLYAENPNANYFCTESDWQSSVSTYGSCGKFVYDSTNNTVRLPKVTGKIDGTTDINALGNLEPLFVRLPNITGSFGGNVFGTTSGAFSYNNTAKGQSGGDRDEQGPVTFNASRSSSVYSGNGSNTSIHEQAVKMFVYIVIATSTKTDIQVDIDQIATDLNSKAGTDLANVTDTGKILMSGMGMPSNTYNSLAIGASGTTYTAPTNGYFYIYGGSGNDTSYHYITASYNSANNWDSPTLRTSNNASSAALTLFIPVKKQQTIRIEYNVTMRRIVFVYAVGSESEAS